MNPLKNLLLKNKSFISNTSQLEDGDTFISINSGHKFLSKNDEKKVKYILCDPSEADSAVSYTHLTLPTTLQV